MIIHTIEGEAKDMGTDLHKLAEQLLHEDFDSLSPREQGVIERIARGLHISRNVLMEHEKELTTGQRLADHVASFGGSWHSSSCSCWY